MGKEVVGCILNGILLSHEEEHIWLSSNVVDEPISIIQSEVAQKDKDKYQIIIHIYEV